MSFPQRCKVCGKRDKFNFQVTAAVWAAVVPEPFRHRVVCLGCFDAFASQQGIRYADAVSDVIFVGDAAHFTFQIQGFLNRPD